MRDFSFSRASTTTISIILSSCVLCASPFQITSSPVSSCQSSGAQSRCLMHSTHAPENHCVSDGNITISTTTSKSEGRLLREQRNEDHFQLRVREVTDFVSIHSHGSIPIPYHDNPLLGIWAANIRRQYVLWEQCNRRGVPYRGYLTADKRRRLELAGFEFSSLTEHSFMIRFKELKQFKERFGHCQVPQKWDENIVLGAWVSNLRSMYKRRRAEASSSDKRSDTDNGRQKKNSKIVLQSYRTRKKRHRYRSPRLPRPSYLSDGRIELLENIGFTWYLDDLKWLRMLEWAKLYGVASKYLNPDSNGENNEGSSQVDTAVLSERYQVHVRNIQNQSNLATFHPQEELLRLLLGDEISQVTFGKSNELSLDLDYRIPPNDELHRPLRIWMINQRSHCKEIQSSPSTTTLQRRQALERIHFPWSGRFRNRLDEVQYKKERQMELYRRLEREKKRQQREREERERINAILSRPAETTSLSSSATINPLSKEDLDDDLMALWSAEEDDDEDEEFNEV